MLSSDIRADHTGVGHAHRYDMCLDVLRKDLALISFASLSSSNTHRFIDRS
jgi:hypothetical protein